MSVILFRVVNSRKLLNERKRKLRVESLDNGAYNSLVGALLFCFWTLQVGVCKVRNPVLRVRIQSLYPLQDAYLLGVSTSISLTF